MRCSFSALLRGLGRPSHSHHPGRLSATYNQAECHLQSIQSALTLLFPTRVACVLIEVIRVPSTCLVFGARSGTKYGRPCVCLLLAYIPHHFSLHLAHLHTYQRCVSDILNLFIGHDRGTPTTTSRFLPSHSDRPNFPSQFLLSHLPLSPLPQGRQVGGS